MSDDLLSALMARNRAGDLDAIPVQQWQASGNIPTHPTAVYTWRLEV